MFSKCTIAIITTFTLTIFIQNQAVLAEEKTGKVVTSGNIKYVETKPGSGWYNVYDIGGKPLNALVDELTVKTYTSTAPNPSQESLNKALRNIDRVKVFASGMYIDKVVDEQKVLAESNSDSDVESFKQCMKIKEDPNTFNHCMCLGFPTFTLYKGDKRVAVLGCQHDAAIRWSEWHWDAQLQNPKMLAKWLASHGYEDQLKRLLKAEENAKGAKGNWETWKADCPPCLGFDDYLQSERLYVCQSRLGERKITRIQPAKELVSYVKTLRENYKSNQQAILALLTWAGHDTQYCDDEGRPAVEGLPDVFLDTYNWKEILLAIRATSQVKPLTGAVRYLQRMRPTVVQTPLSTTIISSIPDDIKAKLEHAAQSLDKREYMSFQNLFALN